MDSNYIAQRLAAIGANSDVTQRIEALEAENARLKEQLQQTPQVDFKSETQKTFENSPEFESILNFFHMRFIREKFGTEFRNSPHMQSFQAAANQAFVEFEKNIKKGETRNAQNSSSKKVNGNGNADNRQDG